MTLNYEYIVTIPVPKIPLHVQIMLYNAQPRITGTSFLRFRKKEKRNFYMDDFLYSVVSIQLAKTTKKNLITVFKRGGFNLTKRHSNVKKFCEKISEVESVTVLGLEWNLKRDHLKLCRGSLVKKVSNHSTSGSFRCFVHF